MEPIAAEFIPPNQALATRQQSGLEITVSAALEAQVRAGIEARYALAIRQPRDLDAVRLRILKECRRPRFAEVARYAKPQGRTKIEGPSIRFVEAALRCMTNVYPETSVVYDDPKCRVMRVAVTDLEANVTYSQDVTVSKTVERSNADGREVLGVRQNSAGRAVYIVAATDDETLIKQNSMLSKTLRTLGLRIVPGDIVDEAQEQVIATQRAADQADPDAQRKRLFEAFAEIGIPPEEIKVYVGREVGAADLKNLRALYQAIKQGDVNWLEVMAEKRSGEEGAASKDLAAKLQAKAAATAKPTAATPSPVVDVTAVPDEQLAQYAAALQETSTLAELDAAWAKVSRVVLPSEQAQQLARLYSGLCDKHRAQPMQ